MTTAPCLVSVVTAGCVRGRGKKVGGWRAFSKSVTQVSIILFAVVLLLLLLPMASSVHGLHPGQQQRQVDAEARHVLVRVVLRRVEALRLGQEIFGDVQVQETVLRRGPRRRRGGCV